MHNIRTSKNAPTIPAESKKPNILRRKTAFRPESGVVGAPEGKSFSILETIRNPTTKPSPVKESVSNNGVKAIKTNSRGRKPAQRIILDSYICNKLKSDVSKNVQNPVILPTSSITNNQQNVISIENVFDSAETLIVALENGELGESQFLTGEGTEQQHFWLCPIINCGKLCSDRSTLHIHILSHCDINAFKCNIEGCSQEFISENQLKQHIIDVHGMIETINIVEESKKVEKINNHALNGTVDFKEDDIRTIKLPDGTRHWVCPHPNCESMFKCKNVLKNHVEIHTEEIKPFKCTHEGCKWAFRSLYKLKCHSTVHNVRESGQHVCTHPGCHKTFSTKYNLSAHKRLHDKSQDRRIACPANGCNRFFQERSLIEAHLSNEHTPQQAPHKCGSCAKTFWWSTGMVAHARVHAQSPGEPICSWPGCGRRFTQPCRLRYHLRSHTGDKPYRCTYQSCNWAFTSSGKLKRHARAHGGDGARRYECEICKRAFRRPEHLREHLPRHLPQRNHLCDYPGCNQKFSNKSSVYAHKKRDHESTAKTSAEFMMEQEIKNLIQSPDPSLKICDDMLSLRSARTHVPWSSENPSESQTSQILEETGILQHQSSCDEKQGNPLVCGGLGLEGENSVVSAGFIMECEETEVGGLPELESDLLCPSVDQLNSLLLQEELSDGMLYTTEDEAALHILLLSEDP